LAVEKGLATRAELENEAGGAFPLAQPCPQADLDAPTDLLKPRFAVGDSVRVRNHHPLTHTRCPNYVRGKVGRVVRDDGPCNFDDADAAGAGRRLEPLYSVRFGADELWGSDADLSSAIHVDLFESYLEDNAQ
jgi:nitrile hydratase